MKPVGKRLQELIADLEVLSVWGDLQATVRGVHYDSRRISSGDLFVALPGLTTDGHRYVAEAAARGAAAAVVSQEVLPGSLKTVVRVPETRTALARISATFWDQPSLHLSLVGVTGTNGKTTLCYLVEHAVKMGGGVPGVVGTVDVHYPGHQEENLHTTPEASDLQELLHRMLTQGVTHVAMEVSSHALHQERVRGCHFQVGVFTNLSRDHLDYHRDLERYAAAKSLLFSRELFESQARKKVAVANRDDVHCREILGGWQGELLTFGCGQAADLHPVGEVQYRLGGFRARVAYPGGELELLGRLPGQHNLYNSLAALAVAAALEIPMEVAARGIAACERVPGRLERMDAGRGPAVFVDYAHTDQALANVLYALRPLATGRLVVVFGCGGDRDRGKRPLMGRAVARGADLALVTSDNPRMEDPLAIIEEVLPGLNAEGWQLVEADQLRVDARGRYAVVADRREAINRAVGAARTGDVVLIAGKGHENYQIIGANRYPFDDCEEARRAVLRCFGGGRE